MVRCFVAVESDPSSRARLAELSREIAKLGLDAKPVEAENLHVTLVFLGELSEREVAAKVAALKTLSFPSFDFELRGMGFFPSRSHIATVWAGCGEGSDKLVELQERVAALVGGKEERGFTPHVALARVKSPRNADRLRALADRHVDEVWGTLRVDAVAFKRSILTSNGPVYQDVARVALGG